ncbi:hypothetical protein BU17DRAFT_85239 [Hysterangium stoloniferum]|nr:hypothetical protein BU17DRAFT_85239 [Hysterangium stoloniferum]
MFRNCAKPWCMKKVAGKTRCATIKSNCIQKDGNKRKKSPSTSSDEDRPSTQYRSTVSDGTEERSSDDEGYKTHMPIKKFASAQDLYDTLCIKFKAGADISFQGSYKMSEDSLVSEKERVQMVAREICVKDNKKLKCGHRTCFWCSQDEAHKKWKSSTDPNIKNRENPGMKQFPCHSKLGISCCNVDGDGSMLITVQLEHHHQHINYVDVSMPLEALQMIRDNLEWLTPTAMVTKIQAAFHNVTRLQIHTAWSKMSEVFWHRDKEQLLSARKLLREFGEEVDVFDIVEVPDGVEMLCWGMKKIIKPLDGKVVEIGVDATYNTNSKHLELYSVMGEYDNAGFPLSYCLLSTSSAVDQGVTTVSQLYWSRGYRHLSMFQVTISETIGPEADICFREDQTLFTPTSK